MLGREMRHNLRWFEAKKATMITTTKHDENKRGRGDREADRFEVIISSYRTPLGSSEVDDEVDW